VLSPSPGFCYPACNEQAPVSVGAVFSRHGGHSARSVLLLRWREAKLLDPHIDAHLKASFSSGLASTRYCKDTLQFSRFFVKEQETGYPPGRAMKVDAKTTRNTFEAKALAL
jgi:hypothetical protein